MKVKRMEEIHVHLQLTESEAIWLQDYIQNNPRRGNEHSEDTAKRKELFESLSVALKRYPVVSWEEPKC